MCTLFAENPLAAGDARARAPKAPPQPDYRAPSRPAAQAAATAAGAPLGIALLEGGKQRMRHDTDHEQLFRQESFFAWLFGVTEAGFYGSVDLRSGRATLFMPRLPREYATWMGRIKSPEEVRARYGVDEVRYTDALLDALAAAPIVHLLCGLNTDSGAYAEPATAPGLEALPRETELLHAALVECRVTKSEAEIEVLRYAVEASSAAHVAVMRAAAPGLAEYQLEATFLHHAYFNAGCRIAAYTCICATGANAATLHYGAPRRGPCGDRGLRTGGLARRRALADRLLCR